MTDFNALKILIVDDSYPMRDMILYILRKAGFQNLIEAADGDEAFAILRKEDIGLVIADWKMPKMSGLELLGKIRADARLKCLPVIMVTSEGDRDNVTKAIQAGASDYVLKPIYTDTLLKKIVKVVEQSAACRTPSAP